MEKIKLNFAHLCDLAFLSQEGKVNVIGIFKVIFAQGFPATHTKFSVVTSLLLDNAAGSHKEIIQIFKKGDDQKVIIPEISFDFEIDEKNNKNGEINLIADIGGITFSDAGEYEVRIIVDGVCLKVIPFLAKKI